MKTKPRFLKGILGLLLIGVLAACSPAATVQTDTNSASLPVTGATSTSAAYPATTMATSTSAAYPAATMPSASTPTPADTSAASSGGVKYVLVPGKSEASYTVREQLARLNLPTDAVGKTTAVSGQLVLNADGTIDTANSKFTVDASSLATDSGMRDGYVKRNILQTDKFPEIVFVPTAISGLPSPLPQSGDVKYSLTGNLTIRDVTKPVTWDVVGTLTNGVGSGTATTQFTFEDFNLSQPSVPVVLSVVDKINLALKLDIQPASK